MVKHVQTCLAYGTDVIVSKSATNPMGQRELLLPTLAAVVHSGRRSSGRRFPSPRPQRRRQRTRSRSGPPGNVQLKDDVHSKWQSSYQT
ncbi:hypothetical protein ON010_g16792 [Phytophthora cinnamomi]|nr:hypothetical protein ON010_g16792 [Phytophthora cinnamomi]